MNKLTTKKRSKKGFTLVEMLIVIAIIAILIAIAIPIFSAQLSAAETRVQEANMRSASSLAYADYMLAGSTDQVAYYYTVDEDNSNMTLQSTSSAITSASGYHVLITSNGAVVTPSYVK